MTQVCFLCLITLISTMLISTIDTVIISPSPYLVITDSGGKTWLDANSYCNTTYGTNLGTILTDDEAYTAIQNVNDSTKPNGQMWVGLNDWEQEGIWVWADGTTCSPSCNKTYWNGIEPNDKNLGEDCGAIRPYGGLTNLFNDYPCDDSRDFICQAYNPTSTPTLNPTLAPTYNPTFSPTMPTNNPTFDPTSHPTSHPTYNPTNYPTYNPTFIPTVHPTDNPTWMPTKYPTFEPTMYPTDEPTLPTYYPTKPIDVEIIDVSTTLNKQENIIYMETKNNNNIFVIVLVFSCIVLCLCAIIIGMVIWIKKSKRNTAKTVDLEMKPHSQNIGTEIDRVMSLSSMTSEGNYHINEMKQQTSTDIVHVGKIIRDVSMSPLPPQVPPVVVTDYEGDEGHNAENNIINYKVTAGSDVENEIVNTINKTYAGNEYETPFQVVNRDDEVVNQINKTNVGDDYVTPFDVVDDNNLTVDSTKGKGNGGGQIWFAYANKYGEQPQNASQLLAFSKTNSQYESLTFKEAKNIYDQMK
eukprot:491743_1